MRFGAPVFRDASDLDAWVKAHKERGYTAAYSPVENANDEGLCRDVERAAERAGIIIAEVGAWSNPMSPDADEAAKSLAKCRAALRAAELVGARCAVNIAGSVSSQWDGPHPDNLTRETFDRVVEIMRAIIDDVTPSRTFYALEPMPWMYPHSPDSYLDLIKAVDRKAFAVHLDPVNMITSPERYYQSGAFVRECFAKLGPWIRSCHGKDITLSGRLTVHLDEAAPGKGGFDLGAYLDELRRADPEIPLMLEHLKTVEEFDAAAAHVRKVGRDMGITF